MLSGLPSVRQDSLECGAHGDQEGVSANPAQLVMHTESAEVARNRTHRAHLFDCIRHRCTRRHKPIEPIGRSESN